MDVYLYESQPYKMLPKYEFLWWVGERRRCKENRKKRLKFMLWLKTVPIKQNGTHTFLKRTPHCSLFKF